MSSSLEIKNGEIINVASFEIENGKYYVVKYKTESGKESNYPIGSNLQNDVSTWRGKYLQVRKEDFKIVIEITDTPF